MIRILASQLTRPRRFIYTGEFELLPSQQCSDAKKPSLASLGAQYLSIGDRFQLPDLRELCVAKLAAAITTDNAAELMLLADSRNLPQLKTAVLDYVRADYKQRMPLVMKPDAFHELSKPVLMQLFALSVA